jgi:crossover junction endodeoxyribonuclease RuvC
MPPKVQSFIAAVNEKDSPFHRMASRARRSERLSTLPPSRVVLGVDPGLHRTGWGVVGIEVGPRHFASGVLKPRANAALEERLETLHHGLSQVIETYHPDVVVIEELFSMYAHPRSALLMAHARGVLMLAARQAGVAVHSFLPNEVKQVIAGDGHAGKTAMQNAVKSRLKLKEIPEPHDAADALALALCFVLRQNVNRR